MPEINFLQPQLSHIRHQIRGILDSYTHDWDLLAELCQNAIDAIRQTDVARGYIEITVDAYARRIICSDNGKGIDPNEAPALLSPFGTNKLEDPMQIGEKGVGLTFVIFCTSEFRMDSATENGRSSFKVSGAKQWLDTSEENPLTLQENEQCQVERGTRVELQLPDDHPLFDLTVAEVMFLLRTKTAIGDTGYIWGEEFPCDFALVHIDRSGRRTDKHEPCRYLRPIDVASESALISLDSYMDWLQERDRSDQQKRRKLAEKIVHADGREHKQGRTIRYWSCFVPNRAVWEQLSTKAGLGREEENEDEASSDLPEYLTGFRGGLLTSTRGMPTGISLDLRPKGSAGYVPNFFILIDDPYLSFDIGRKAIQGRQQSMLRDIAHEEFRRYINQVRKYMGGPVDDNPSIWERDEIFNDIHEMPNLNSSSSRFSKRPNGQEATVAALFFEAIGTEAISSITPLISGYKGRYDLYAKWGHRNVVIEFKHDLAGLFKDFNDERKMFDEVDTVVVWEVTEQDRYRASRRGVEVEPVGADGSSGNTILPEAGIALYIENVKPISVIEMKRLVHAQ